MAEYNINGGENDPIWLELKSALEAATADVPSDHKVELIEYGMEKIQQTCRQYTPAQVISTLRHYLNNDVSYELFWLARAGIAEAEHELQKLLDSDKELEIVDAATGLAFLDLEIGYSTIESLCKRTHRVKLSMSPYWWFHHNLLAMSTTKGRNLLQRMESGEFNDG